VKKRAEEKRWSSPSFVCSHIDITVPTTTSDSIIARWYAVLHDVLRCLLLSQVQFFLVQASIIVAASAVAAGAYGAKLGLEAWSRRQAARGNVGPAGASGAETSARDGSRTAVCCRALLEFLSHAVVCEGRVFAELPGWCFGLLRICTEALVAGLPAQNVRCPTILSCCDLPVGTAMRPGRY
jgi:hypothetical protein